MFFTADQLTEYISSYFWPFVRISSMMMAAPIFGAATIIPVRVRLMLALAITAIVAPVLAPFDYVDPASAAGVLLIAQQILLGLAMGLIMQMAFATLTLGGLSISMPMGLGFANMVDPVNGVQTPVISTFFIMLGTLLFLAIDGHLLLVQVVVDSFNSLPISASGLSEDGLMKVALWGGRIYMGGILIALPAIVIITLINISFGVMTRAAPQLNIFSVGFPTTMASGFLVLYLILPNLIPRFISTVYDAFDTLNIILGISNG